jgi:hypothetical protein
MKLGIPAAQNILFSRKYTFVRFCHQMYLYNRELGELSISHGGWANQVSIQLAASSPIRVVGNTYLL